MNKLFDRVISLLQISVPVYVSCSSPHLFQATTYQKIQQFYDKTFRSYWLWPPGGNAPRCWPSVACYRVGWLTDGGNKMSCHSSKHDHRRRCLHWLATNWGQPQSANGAKDRSVWRNNFLPRCSLSSPSTPLEVGSQMFMLRTSCGVQCCYFWYTEPNPFGSTRTK